jgi:hypothetical protein
MIPGIGVFATIAKTALTIISSADALFKKGIPMGLIDVGLNVLKNALPGPLGAIAQSLDKIMPIDKALVPAAVQAFVPSEALPVAKGISDLLFPAENQGHAATPVAQPA